MPSVRKVYGNRAPAGTWAGSNIYSADVSDVWVVAHQLFPDNIRNRTPLSDTQKKLLLNTWRGRDLEYRKDLSAQSAVMFGFDALIGLSRQQLRSNRNLRVQVNNFLITRGYKAVYNV